VFVALGLTVHLAGLGAHAVIDGFALTLVLLTAARLPAVVALLGAFRLPARECVFVAWAGMRGAVPILLASLALTAGIADASRVYGLVFIVVAVSVLVQGGSLPWAAARLGVR
jgi:cell volume regulation protein A